MLYGVIHQRLMTLKRQVSKMTEAIVCAIIAALSAVTVGVINYHSQKTGQKELKDEIEQNKLEREQREQSRKEFGLKVIKGIMASISLSEATAKAVQRIPDTHCNGDMTAALEEEESVKREIREFLAKQGVDNINK